MRCVPCLIERSEQCRCVFAGRRRDSGDRFAQSVSLGIDLGNVVTVVAVAHPPANVGPQERDAASGNAGPAQPPHAPLHRHVATGNEVLLENDFLQQVLQKVAFAGACPDFRSTHPGSNAERPLHRTEDTIKRRALLGARGEVHTAQHGLLGKF
ncbi:MAG: hypothetical protein BWZ07_03200 [Alphaproteobacteria bacterium ADurb.BinA280]|nr:MAG: hypothetical protein BWZ07_03200 [Alphaproteobacteria bacterium ADurb.BinA280]